MARLFKKKAERERSLWRQTVDLAFTDVRVLAKGMDEATLQLLEERLLEADFGVHATLRLVDRVADLARQGKIRGGKQLERALQDEIVSILRAEGEDGLNAADQGPTVYLLVGVNGVGKTTSVAKLAFQLRREGKRVLLAAADTYRAGAVEQLGIWADRVGADFVRGQQGGDPGAVAFDALEAATRREAEVVLVDTAGRLHTNRSLMEELAKVERVVARKVPGAPHETLVVLDATVGQNALNQVRTFQQVISPTGIVLAKLDSTAKGGIVVALKEEFGIPVKLVGTGEGLEDLELFDAEAFTRGVFEDVPA